jgi:predicted ATPase
MRIAFSGTHRAGKTTLLEAVASRLPRYRAIEEPYHLLEEEGVEFSNPPAVEDFVRQLERSLLELEEAPANALLDRCPLDFLAYLRALDPDFELEEWLLRAGGALPSLDLIVVVPIEEPDLILLPPDEDRRLRRTVDEGIRAMVLEDSFDFGLTTIEVQGDVEERVRQVMRAVR